MISLNAKQPMVNQETGVVLAFNGEIYNYRELIRKHNLDIKNNSDTKVILHMYLKIGLEFVSELNCLRYVYGILDTNHCI